MIYTMYDTIISCKVLKPCKIPSWLEDQKRPNNVVLCCTCNIVFFYINKSLQKYNSTCTIYNHSDNELISWPQNESVAGSFWKFKIYSDFPPNIESWYLRHFEKRPFQIIFKSYHIKMKNFKNKDLDLTQITTLSSRNTSVNEILTNSLNENEIE